MLNVCIVTTSLAAGGAERSAALLSQMLFSLGYNVHVISTKNRVEYPFSGTLFNLEKEINGSNNNWRKLKVLRAYLKKHQFNYVIDNRPHSSFFKEFLLYRLVFSKAKIVTVIRSFNLNTYLPKNRTKARIIFGGVENFVAVSNEIKEEIERKMGFKNVVRIYNPIKTEEEVEVQELKNTPNLKYILFFGRIQERSKNLSLLIDGYKASKLPQYNIKLIILGSGPDLNLLKEKVKEHNLLDYVVFIPFKPNPKNYIKNAMFTVLTSNYEGFPRSVTESLALGTPVISVDCKSGPKEIIINESNGLLIEQNNSLALSKAMNRFVDDKNLYTRCKENAIQSVKHLSTDKIALHWQKILLNE
ncbi:glycosyltransferase [Tamlana sp. 62-3]|uniref:Glycosyltransferase n=1 Tax=Neotamlana sargassicola TaxID=2883125 RepID=A0A9X1L7V3_9FLAO|nr:glycosyltransferase [Tamlana sargassicola]MCB4808894.1 glycosyltransferase [Tamlana sargassicola]